jgi:hypothetical protein
MQELCKSKWLVVKGSYFCLIIEKTNGPENIWPGDERRTLRMEKKNTKVAPSRAIFGGGE